MKDFESGEATCKGMSMISAKEFRLLPLADVVKKSGPFEGVDLLRSESLQTCIVPSQVHDQERVEFNTVLFKLVFHDLHKIHTHSV